MKFHFNSLRPSDTYITGDPLHSRALAHSRAPLFTQPCPHCSHSRAPGEQWARLCVFTLQGCVQAARLCRGSPVYICIGNLTIIVSCVLSPGWQQAIIWSNAGILLIGPLGTNFSEILIEIETFSLKKIRLKMLSAKYCPFRLGLNVLTVLNFCEYILRGLPFLYSVSHEGDGLDQGVSRWRSQSALQICWREEIKGLTVTAQCNVVLSLALRFWRYR